MSVSTLILVLTIKVLVTTIDALVHKQYDYSTVGGDGGCRVGEVRAGTISPMPGHKGFKQQLLSEINSLHLSVNFQKLSTLRN